MKHTLCCSCCAACPLSPQFSLPLLRTSPLVCISNGDLDSASCNVVSANGWMPFVVVGLIFTVSTGFAVSIATTVLTMITIIVVRSLCSESRTDTATASPFIYTDVSSLYKLQVTSRKVECAILLSLRWNPLAKPRPLLPDSNQAYCHSLGYSVSQDT